MSFENTLTYKGETLTVAEWSRKTGLKDKTIYMRVMAGWPTEKILETPLKVSRFSKNPANKLGVKEGEEEARKERALVRKYLKTQPSYVDERREEGEIL